MILTTVLFFLQLGKPKLWDRDEPRNAGCAVEMLARGDWVVPVFNGELRTHKPILLYWLIMASYAVFGVGEFSARFWSAALAVGTVVTTYQMGRRLFGTAAAWWGAAILSTTLMFNVAAHAATPDSPLIFFTTLALYLFVRGGQGWSFGEDVCLTAGEGRGILDSGSADDRGYFPHRPVAVAGIYAAMGMAVLAKGPVGLVLPVAVVGMFLLIMGSPSSPPVKLSSDRRSFGRWLRRIVRPFEPAHFLRTCRHMRPLIAIGVVSLVAGPWYAWVSLRTDGVWVRDFLLEHNVSRALTPMEGHAGPALLFYPLAILVGFFPWSILTIPLVVDLVRSLRRPASEWPALVFLACWVAVYVVVFSSVQTKLPSYVTPCYPALALIAGRYVHRWMTNGELSAELFPWGIGTLALVGLVALVGIPLAARQLLPGAELLGLVGIVPLSGAVALALVLRMARRELFMRLLLGTSAGFVLAVFAFFAPGLSRHQQYERLFRHWQGTDRQIAAFGSLEPSWVFYGAKPIRMFDSDELAALIRFVAEDPHRVVITTAERAELLAKSSASRLHPIERAPYFLRDRQLVVLSSDEVTLARPTTASELR
jgi:4-amino-4-deoxy-L-arabinose transferase-like glycosyltransferase